jgi:hypothetical protein
LRDVATNAFADDGRLFVLILDDIHSLMETTPVFAAAARRLVERLSPQDQLAVLWLSTDKQGAFEFTTNHAAVLAAIDEFNARKARAELLGPPLLESLGEKTPDIQKKLGLARARGVSPVGVRGGGQGGLPRSPAPGDAAAGRLPPARDRDDDRPDGHGRASDRPPRDGPRSDRRGQH